MSQAVEIYKVLTAHRTYGNNWGSYKVAARNCEEAIRKAKRDFIRGERIQEIEMLASTR